LLVRLEAWGLRATAVADGPAALSVLQQARTADDPFQLALIDMQMPGMDGESLGRVIKADERLTDTAVALLTSLSRGNSHAIGQELGFAAYLNKPVRHEELRQTLIQMLTGQTLSGATASGAVAPQQTAENDELSAQPFARRDARILLAEDNATNQQVALAILRKLGLTAETAENGRDAWHMAAARPYDLILMDLQMPEMDGLEATRRLRAAGQQAPIIALTAHAMAGDREKCLAAGMNDYLSKPISPAALRQALRQWLPHLDNRHDFVSPDNTPDETAVWDRAGMLARLMGDEETLNVIAVGFVTDMSQQIAGLRGRLAAADDDGAARQAHTVKGAAANVGGERLRATARQLEEAAAQGDLQAAQNWLTELETEFNRLRELMAQKQ
jgi:CheY-like chemotaxis protein/HPt (histidine-containing phosphotransfer) domain-containing protein